MATTIDWPSTLPQYPDQSGFGEDRVSGKIETEMDSGPNVQRSIFTATPVRFSIQLTLDTDQVGYLDTFYTDTCKNGTLEFNWIHPRTLSDVEMRFVGSPPSVSFKGYDYFTASMTVEVLP